MLLPLSASFATNRSSHFTLLDVDDALANFVNDDLMSRRRSSAPYSWRSTPMSRKSSQAPSISVVFAEPENSSPPSGSAAATLTPVASISAPASSASSSCSTEPGRKHTTRQSRAGSVASTGLGDAEVRTLGLEGPPGPLSSKWVQVQAGCKLGASDKQPRFFHGLECTIQ